MVFRNADEAARQRVALLEEQLAEARLQGEQARDRVAELKAQLAATNQEDVEPTREARRPRQLSPNPHLS